MSTPLPDAASTQPNLTPILDMVFQLITFFMLVINFKSASLERSLKLPVVGSARPVDNQGQDDVLVLNVDAEGNLLVYGQPKEIETYISAEAYASGLAARRDNSQWKMGDDLPSTVVIRADQATQFGMLNKVISTCQRHGFRRFSLKAMNKTLE